VIETIEAEYELANEVINDTPNVQKRSNERMIFADAIEELKPDLYLS
jgi:hypothetical protein